MSTSKCFSLFVVAIIVGFLLVGPGMCQNLFVTFNGDITFWMYTYNVDMSDTTSDSYIALQNDTETALNRTLTPEVSFENLTPITQNRDDIFQMGFTLEGDAVNASRWLISLFTSGIKIRGHKIPVAVSFENPKRQSIKVFIDQVVCDIRIILIPCEESDECIEGICVPRTVYKTTTGNLIVLGIGGGLFLVSLLFILIFCFWNFMINRKKGEEKDTPSANGV
uniref:Integrin alpha-2 domain-containing protein n=1 Tax=Arion vulgaris TaxID=1028688 RepID=A0A0B7AWJ8_9EUPU